MAGIETAQVLAWLYTTLSGDSALTSAAPGGIWRNLANPGASTPYVIMNLQSSADVITANAYRLFDRGTFHIKAVGPATAFSSIVTAANRIDALLGRASGPITSGSNTILACYRTQTIEMGEIINGEAWDHLGGLFEIYVQ
jgi:hypothetical protein